MICDFNKHMRSYIEGKGREDEEKEMLVGNRISDS